MPEAASTSGAGKRDSEGGGATLLLAPADVAGSVTGRQQVHGALRTLQARLRRQISARHTQLQLSSPCLRHQLGDLALPLDTVAEGVVGALSVDASTSRALLASSAIT